MKKMKRKKRKKEEKEKNEKEMKKESPRRQRTLLKHHPAAHLNTNLIRYTYTNIVVQRI